MLLPLDIHACALLLIDAQRDFLEPREGLIRGRLAEADPGPLAERWQRLIEALHQAGRPVIFAVTRLRPDRADWALPEARRGLRTGGCRPPERLRARPGRHAAARLLGHD